jgi:hypothetical protein
MRRSGPIARKTAIKRTAMKKKPKSPERWAYQYWTPERVEWVKTLLCFGQHFPAGPCGGRKANCHVGERSGMGLKGPYWEIACGCERHHTMYDKREAPFDQEPVRESVRHLANLTEAAWQDRRE